MSSSRGDGELRELMERGVLYTTIEYMCALENEGSGARDCTLNLAHSACENARNTCVHGDHHAVTCVERHSL